MRRNELKLTFLLCFALSAGTGAASADSASSGLYEQRALYRAALDHLTAGRTSAFRKAEKRLADYPLAPYLDYYRLQTRLSSVTDREMRTFRDRHADLPVSDIMFRRWLQRLGSRREWSRYLDNYVPMENAELQCYYLRALIAKGRSEEAYEATPSLWTVARSQPKACDPLFDQWIAADRLTEGIVWERLQLALAKNQRQLARYLLRFFKGPLKTWASELYNVHVSPSEILKYSKFSADDTYQRSVIAHGVKRLAREEADDARRAWETYQTRQKFDEAEALAVEEAVTLAEAREGRFPSQPLASASEKFLEDMAEAAVDRENWSEALAWIERLPTEAFNSNRWQYWLGRALSQTYLNSERARLTYRALATERDYYGFLAAEQIGYAMQLNRAPPRQDQAGIAGIARIPAVSRAMELYAVGDTINARREWFKVLPTLDRDDQLEAAYLAQAVGWTSESIRMVNAAKLWDHLDLRFPLAYPNLYQRVSFVTTVPEPFLLAISRQESLFDPRARSSANARGLMQLLHSTAVLVAKRVGTTSPTTTDLYDPTINVELGGHHLARLLGRYGNRRPLAAAAYNAGEHRVDRWIGNASGKPMDVWIESIPFGETRKYVKNVMYFAQVYGQLQGESPPMLKVSEARVP